MMIYIPFAAALMLFALTPVHAQDAVDAVEHAVEAAEAAAESMATDTSGEGAATNPQLTDFDLFQNKPEDYPPLSWVNDEQGTAYFEVVVDAGGNVSDCTIIDTTGHAALDAKTCEIVVARGKFYPAYDESGSPVAGTHRDFMVWTKREPQFPGTSTIHVQFTATASGEIEDCEVVEISGYIGESMRDTMEREPCPGMSRSARPPYRDEDGNPVAKRVDLMIVVKTEDVAE